MQHTGKNSFSTADIKPARKLDTAFLMFCFISISSTSWTKSVQRRKGLLTAGPYYTSTDGNGSAEDDGSGSAEDDEKKTVQGQAPDYDWPQGEERVELEESHLQEDGTCTGRGKISGPVPFPAVFGGCCKAS